LESHDLAWAAGFFDGEGWANRQRRGVQSRADKRAVKPGNLGEQLRDVSYRVCDIRLAAFAGIRAGEDAEP